MMLENIKATIHPKDSTFEPNFDKMIVASGNIKRPVPAQTDDGANQTYEEVELMPILPQEPIDTLRVDRPAIVRQYLQLTKVQMEQAIRNRDLYTKLAKSYGLTNQAIGNELGITEARVRQILAAE